MNFIPLLTVRVTVEHKSVRLRRHTSLRETQGFGLGSLESDWTKPALTRVAPRGREKSQMYK